MQARVTADPLQQIQPAHRLVQQMGRRHSHPLPVLPLHHCRSCSSCRGSTHSVRSRSTGFLDSRGAAAKPPDARPAAAPSPAAHPAIRSAAPAASAGAEWLRADQRQSHAHYSIGSEAISSPGSAERMASSQPACRFCQPPRRDAPAVSALVVLLAPQWRLTTHASHERTIDRHRFRCSCCCSCCCSYFCSCC